MARQVRHVNTTHTNATTDPVCGMRVDSGAPITADHHGRSYVFCSGSCRDRFLGDPDRYASELGASMAVRIGKTWVRRGIV